MLYNLDPVLGASAVIPAVFLMWRIYKTDRLEKEPASLLISLMLWGIVSTFIALVAESAGERLISWLDPNSAAYNAILYFGIVAYSEEGAKYLVLKKKTWKNPAFNCTFDGVVYSVFVSLGFALWENMQYVGMYGLETALIRAVTAVPGHGCFGVFMGVWYGAAKRYEHMGKYRKAEKARTTGVLVAAFMHGMYDFIGTMGGGISLIFLLFAVSMFIWASRLVKKMSAGDRYI